jgi:hypothetical protein
MRAITGENHDAMQLLLEYGVEDHRDQDRDVIMMDGLGDFWGAVSDCH